MIKIEDQLPLGPGVKIIKYDPACGLLALEKPSGVKSHPNKKGIDKNSLLVAEYDLKAQCYRFKHEQGGTEVFLLNRLDSPTSGVLLLAMNEDVAKIVREMFRSRQVEKVYHAIIRGRPRLVPPTWTDNLEVTNKGGVLRSKRAPGVLAKTKVEFVRTDSKGLGLSLIKLLPQTGRTHQLRVQCASRGHPIVGDKSYGDFKFNREIKKVVPSNRLYLHASSLKLEFSFKGNNVSFQADSQLPTEFDAVMG